MDKNVRIAKELVKIAKDFMASNDSTSKIKEVLLGMKDVKQISDEYWRSIAESIADDVVEDVQETADPDEWNEDDIRLAIGRVLCDRLGINE